MVSQPNPNWPRWLKLSIINHFKPLLDALPLPWFVEGTSRRTKGEQSHCEIRIDGPFLNEISKGYWCFDVTVDVLVVTYKDTVDLLLHEKNVGIVLAGFNSDIPVMMWGDGPGDNPDLMLECLKPTPPPKGDLIVTNFGQVEAESRILQSTVEQSFQMNLIT